MTRKKSHSRSQLAQHRKVITAPLLLLLGAATIAYYLAMAAIYALFGERLAAWLANPLFGIAVFFIARWDGTRQHQDKGWREYLRFPRLTIWKLLLIIAVIFVVQFIAGFISERYLEETRPDLFTEDFLEGFYAQFDVWGSTVIFVTGIVLSFFVGGYVAGKLSPFNYLRPYSHAAVGEFVFYLQSVVIMQILFVCKCGTPPTQKDIGWAVVWAPPYLLLTLFGTWVAIHTRLMHRLDMIGRSILATGTRLSRGRQ